MSGQDVLASLLTGKEFGFTVKKKKLLQIPFSRKIIGLNKYEVKENEVPVKPDLGLLAIRL